MVIDMLGPDLPVTQVNARRVEDMVLKMVQLGNSDSTINRKMSALSTMLKYAVKHQYIPHMPSIPRRKEPENRIRWMTDYEEAEMLAFFQYIGQEDMEDFIKVALDTGVRRGEMLRIQVRDVHQQKLHIWESKSGKSRAVPLTKRASAVLGKRMNRTEHPTDKLFGDWSEDSLRHYWDRGRHHLGLTNDPQFGIHVMRHTFCSRLAMKGVPMPAIKELAGHSSIVTTQRYVHMSPSSLSDAIGLLEKNSGLQSAEEARGISCGADSGVASERTNSGYQKDSEINMIGYSGGRAADSKCGA
jgi:integrase